jgi:hypothetical protein
MQYTWIFCINMMIRVGIAGWSAWIVYVLVGSMQLTLIAMAICFAIRDHNLAKEGKQHCEVPPEFEGWNTWTGSRRGSIMSHAPSNLAPDERSPLLHQNSSERSPLLHQDSNERSPLRHQCSNDSRSDRR